MTLTLTWEKGQSNSEAGEIFSGKNLALTNTGKKGYFYAWERYHAGGSYLLGTIFNGYGNPLRFSFNLTELLNGVLDQEVAVGSSPNGNLAIAWIRNGNDLFVSIYSLTGVPLVEYQAIPTGIHPSSPRIVADANNNFYVVWVQDGTSQRDIFMAILNPSGEFVLPATPVTDIANTTEDYFSPTITNLRSGGAVIAYSVDTGLPGTPQLIAYNVIDMIGNITQPEQRITYPGISARGKDMIQLTSGKVLIGWIDENTRHVHFTRLINDTTGWNADIDNIEELSPAYQLGAINISVTSDYLDHGIITWAEEKGNRTLSYALIDSSGAVLTPPMVFLRGTGVDTNAAGQGNAPY
ncbi:hypothetical protein EG832_20305, partial [bacterium]|nr:hypothetical protein [bacterium]